MTQIGHVMILASAGSGKTYALTNRYVRLLALGARPERIVALTFTRKAAGEFFDEILNKLARAATDPVFACKLTGEIGLGPEGDPAAPGPAHRRPESGAAAGPDYLHLLRTVADAMHQLRLGTLDGFFARIASSFPLELGLSGEFEILEEHAARAERTRVLRRLFERAGALGPAQREFIEAFKRATFGLEEKRLGAQLDEFLDRHQEVFLAAPAADLWGNPARIWPAGSHWLGPAADPGAAVKTLRAWVDAAAIGDRQRARWQAFLEAWTGWSPGIAPARPLAYVLEKALDAWRALEAGNAVLEFDRKKQELHAEACAALAVLTRHIVGGELARRLEVTCGIHGVLAGYEAVYHDAVRRMGRLTFGDIQRLLQPDDGAPVLGGGDSLSPYSGDKAGGPAGGGGPGAAGQLELPLAIAEAAPAGPGGPPAGRDRLAIDYRLDAGTDHWLLDEFQDTSHGQWSILRNLIDEVVQDPTGTRSFFYVGDVKQAIFAWREGDPRLFREIFEHYNRAQPGTIVEQHLVDSWRSGPPIVATVNRVFGNAPVLAALFPGDASRDWNREWLAHKTAKPELDGQAALLHADDEAGRFATALALLREIEPLERGLSCALLVQRNDTAAALADYLRREGGLPAVAESDLHVCTDNPAGAALLALVQAAAHPGDTLAWEHVQMSPLRGVLAGEGLRTPEDIARRLLAEIHAGGFERTTLSWARRLEPTLTPDDTFSRERLRQFTAAAARFDATGSRDVAEFIAFMESHTVRDVDNSAVLRVMTVHKAKGLGFDVVILPDLEGQKLDGRRDGLAVHRGPDRAIEWVLDLPARLFHANDEVLARHVHAAEADACYEAISLLYVALTRAKRAVYLVTRPPGASTSRNYPRLLAETLGAETRMIRIGASEFAGAFAEGDADWHTRLERPPPAPEAPPAVPRLDTAQARRAPRLAARLPSAAGAVELSGDQLFSLERRDAADFGTGVHRLLAEVEWAGAGSAPALAAAWSRRGLAPDTIAEAIACVRAAALDGVWARRPSAEVWRERPFEIVIDGTWITGVFDRVIVERDAAGRPVRATVFDFKTDRARTDADLTRLARRHAAQLASYRRVAAVLTGIPPEQVRGGVVFTRLQRVVPAEPPGEPSSC